MKTKYSSLLVVTRAKWLLMGLVLAVVLWFPHQDATAGQAPVNLGSAASFAVLAGTAVTSTGGGAIYGDVGVSPAAAIDYGTPPVIVYGTVHLGDPIAAQAQRDLTTAYNDAATRPGATPYAQELGGNILTPGLYNSMSGSFHITTPLNLTLNAQGNPNAVWIFQLASDLIVGTGCQVILAGGAQARNIFWQVGSSATLGVDSVFKGNILALTAITMDTGASLAGRALARNANVTLIANNLVKQPLGPDQPWRLLLM